MKKHPLEGILEKRCSFFLAGIDTLIDFVVLEKMKTERCRGHSYRSSILKKDQRSNPKNLIVPFIKLKGAEKDKILSDCVVSTFAANSTLKYVLGTTRKLKPDLNTKWDLIREEKYVHFYQIWIYFEDSTWVECLKLYDKKKSLKWLCSVCQKIIAMSNDSVVCELWLKWNHLSCTSLRSHSKIEKCILNVTYIQRLNLDQLHPSTPPPPFPLIWTSMYIFDKDKQNKDQHFS